MIYWEIIPKLYSKNPFNYIIYLVSYLGFVLININNKNNTKSWQKNKNKNKRQIKNPKDPEKYIWL